MRGTAQTISELKAVDKEADSLDGRDINLDVDADSSGIRSLGDSFKGLASNIRATGTVLAAASIPFAIAGIGAAAPTILALTASLGGLASALGSGLVGAAVAATGAMGALGGALALVAAPVSMLIGTLKKYDQSLDSTKAAQDAAQAASQSHSDALRSEAEARRNVARVNEESNRQIRAQQQALDRTREEGAENVEEQERSLEEVRRQGAAKIRQEELALSQARTQGVRAVEDQERQLDATREQVRESIEQQKEALRQAQRDADRAILDQERTLRAAEQTASQNNAQAAEELRSARATLTSTTRSLASAQLELNRAELSEPARQEQLTLDLAYARDRAADAAEAAAEAIATYGRHSEEATDALRDQRQAELDLETTRTEVNRQRRRGTDELRGAQEAEKTAHKDEKEAIEAVGDAEKNRNRTRKEGARDVERQAKTLIQLQRDSERTIRQQTEALQEAKQAGTEQIAEQNRLLKRTEQDVARSVRVQQRAVTHARTEYRRSEREEIRALAKAREDALEQEDDAEKALAETRRQTSQQNQAAQKQLTDAMRATARTAEALKDAQKGVREETVKLTPAQKALYNEYKRFQNQADKAFQPAQNAAARLGVEILHLAERYLPRLGKTSEQVMGAVADVFDTFRTELQRPVTQAGITRYLKSLPAITRDAGNAAVKLGLSLFNVFTRTLPFAKDLTSAINDLMGDFLRWTQSARGQNSIDRFFENSVDIAIRFKNILKDLGTGIANVFDSINRSGLDDQALRGLEDLARGFRRITTRGTESREALDRFMKRARSLMPHVANAVGAVVREIAKMSAAIIGARQKGHRLTTLQEIFRGIGRAAKPLRRLVVGTFEDLGPEIAKLIPRLAEFLSVFAGSNGPLVTFVRAISRAVKWFNQLPDPVKRTAANLLTLKLLLGGLGITALLRPLGRFAAGWFLVGRATKRAGAKTALGGMARIVGGLGTVLLAGGVIAAVAGLGAAFIVAYKNNKKFRESVNATVRSLRSWGENKFRQAKAAFRDIFDLDQKSMVKNAKKAADATASAYAQELGKRTKKQEGEGSAGFELGFKTTKAVVEGVSKYLDSSKIPKEGIRPGWLNALLKPFDSANNTIDDVIKGMTRAWKTSDKGNLRDALQKTLQGISLLSPVLKRFQDDLKLLKGLKKDINAMGWKQAGKEAASDIATGWLNGGLVGAAKNLIDNWFRNARSRQESKDFKGLGTGAAIDITSGFASGGVPGAIRAVIDNAASAAGSKKGKFEDSGKDSAWGFLKGWFGAGIPGKMEGTAKDGVEAMAFYGQGRSPWKRTEKMGLDAGKGFAIGLDSSRSAVARSSRGLAQSAVSEIERDFNKNIANLHKRTNKTTRRIERDAEKRASEIAGSYNEIEQRARTRGATPDQLASVQQAREKALLKNRKDAEYQIARIRKDAAEEEQRLEQQKDRRLQKEATHERRRAAERRRETREHRGGVDRAGARVDLTSAQERRRATRAREEERRAQASLDLQQSRARLAEANRNARQRAVASARSPQSAGGAHITPAEMRKIMHEAVDRQGRNMRAAAALVSSSPEFFRYFDSVVSKDFDHRTSMKADAR